MAFRIFDHLLVNHGWTRTGRLVVAAAPEPMAFQPASELSAARRKDIERQSLLARLAYRCKLDPVMCRAARRLQADPYLPMQQLAAELGVSECRLSRGLQAVLGQGRLPG
jgi:AraC-like DNA-binding protein